LIDGLSVPQAAAELGSKPAYAGAANLLANDGARATAPH